MIISPGFFISMSQYRDIGKIISTHGWKGEVLLHHHIGSQISLEGLGAIFLEDRKHAMLPYFVSGSRIKGQQEIYLCLEGIDSKEKARPLLHQTVWLAQKDFDRFADPAAPVTWVGYRLIADEQDLGLIQDIIEQPQQVLCQLYWKGKEILIPIHEETLLRIDPKSKMIWLKLPDGLLDIYLQG